MDDRVAKGLRAAEKRLKAFGDGLRSLGTRVFAAGAAALTPLLGAVKAFSDSGDTLEKMSRRTGVSVEALSELGFAAEQSGADLETLETGLRKMQKFLTEAARGSDGATEALALLRLSLADLANLSPEQQFKLIADRLAQVADPTLRAALALELFGKSGTRLLPLLENGARGIGRFQEEARALGLTMSTDAAKKAALLHDTLNILWRVVKKLTTTIGAALADAVIDLSDRITRVVMAVTAWVQRNQALIVSAAKVAAGVLAAGAALVAAGMLITGLGNVFGWLASAVSTVGAVFGTLAAVLGAMVSPIGLVVAAVAGLGTAILGYTGAGGDALAWLGDTFRWLKDGVLKVVGGIADALAAGGIALAAQILWLSLKLAWQQGIDALNRAWATAKQFFVQTAYDMWYGALFAAETVWHGLEVAWIETTAFLSKTWTNFTSDLQAVWGSRRTGSRSASSNSSTSSMTASTSTRPSGWPTRSSRTWPAGSRTSVPPRWRARNRNGSRVERSRGRNTKQPWPRSAGSGPKPSRKPTSGPRPKLHARKRRSARPAPSARLPTPARYHGGRLARELCGTTTALFILWRRRASRDISFGCTTSAMGGA